MTRKSKITTPPILGTVRQFSDKHPAFSQGALRNMIFQSKPRETSRGPIQGNGMVEAGVLVRLGRKLLINELKFFEWLDAQQPSVEDHQERAPRSNARGRRRHPNQEQKTVDTPIVASSPGSLA